MENFLVEIGGLAVSVQLPGPDFQPENSYLPFLAAPNLEAAAVWVVRREAIPIPGQSPSPSAPPFPRWEIGTGKSRKVFLLRKRKDAPDPWKAGRMTPDLSRGEIWTERSPEGVVHPLRELDQLLFAHFLLPRRGLLIHAAAEIDGAGYLFPAPAGGGKSTWAELMEREPGWTVLGEDRIVLREAGGYFRIFGTPWNPRRKFRKNASAPLEGVFFLHHSPADNIRRLRPAEVLPGLLHQAFLPFPAADELEEALSLLEAAAAKIPAFRFGFRPEQTANNCFKTAIGQTPRAPGRGRRER